MAQTLRSNDSARAEGQSGSSPLTFSFALSPRSTGPGTAHNATANGTALASSDYVAKSGLLSFPPWLHPAITGGMMARMPPRPIDECPAPPWRPEPRPRAPLLVATASPLLRG